MLTFELLNAIESVLGKRLPGAVTAMGTVVSRSTSLYDTACMVNVEGSANAVPAKIFGDVLARSGDRVGLLRIETTWVIVGTYTNRMHPSENGILIAATSGNTSSGSYTNLPGSPSFPFIKEWDETLVFVDLKIGCRTDTAETAVAFGADINGTTYNVAYHVFSSASHRHDVASHHPGIPGIPAGDYTVTPKWEKPLGSGAIYMDSSDWVAVSAREIRP